MSGSPVTGSLFAPFFFPLGIAFMGAQSAVMMKMAGENWQYGKRRISAMTNEEFNKLTPLRLYQLETAELQSIIPSIEQSLQSMTPLTATIVTEMINTFKVGAQATLAYLQDIVDTPLGKVIKFAINVWMPWLNPLLEAGGGVPDFGTIEKAPVINVPIPFEKPKTPFVEPTPGTQVPINKVPATYNVSTAALKLYAQMQGDLVKLNATRQVYLTSQDPNIIKNRKSLLASVDKLRANKFNQINALEKSYPDINKAWKAAYF